MKIFFQPANAELPVRIRLESWDEATRFFAENVGRGAFHLATTEEPQPVLGFVSQILLPERNELALRSRVTGKVALAEAVRIGKRAGFSFMLLPLTADEQAVVDVTLASRRGDGGPPTSDTQRPMGRSSGTLLGLQPFSGGQHAEWVNAERLTRQGRHADARVAMERAVAETPSVTLAMRERLHIICAHEAIDGQRYDVAARHLSDALALNPDSKPALVLLRQLRSYENLKRASTLTRGVGPRAPGDPTDD